MTSGPQSDASDEIRIGISACLLGEKVRFDGGHKQDRFVTGTLTRFISFVPVCPEVDVGMGVPRGQRSAVLIRRHRFRGVRESCRLEYWLARGARR